MRKLKSVKAKDSDVSFRNRDITKAQKNIRFIFLLQNMYWRY